MSQAHDTIDADLRSCAGAAEVALSRFRDAVRAAEYADEPGTAFPTVSWEDVSYLQAVTLELGDVLMSLVAHLPDSPWSAELRQAAVATGAVVHHLDSATIAMPGYGAQTAEERDQRVSLRPQSEIEQLG